MKHEELENTVNKFIIETNDVTHIHFPKAISELNIGFDYKSNLNDSKWQNELQNIYNRLELYGYVEVHGKGIMKLTEKGKAAKLKGGHYKYQKSLQAKMTKFERISLIVAICAIVISILPYFIKADNAEIKDLQKRIKVLENKHK